jgi:frataxin
MPSDDKAFETLAEKTLQDLLEQVDDALGDQIDVDLDGSILSIELESGGQYIINKQAPNREIWMSSPISGAKHFFYDEDVNAWIDTRGSENFYELLSAELSQASGRAFALK